MLFPVRVKFKLDVSDIWVAPLETQALSHLLLVSGLSCSPTLSWRKGKDNGGLCVEGLCWTRPKHAHIALISTLLAI